ncbi:MAG: YggS family pyridoxal phosphate-dependent enzyme [Dehalococcoidia bacterium]|nr:YggS family pyridoxal phosphate-dependent enzyme [Dehalococcoidia bacterium]
MTAAATVSAIGANLAAVHGRIERACERSGRSPADVTLIAVTKTWPAETVLAAMEAGLAHFGENRVQEGIAKAADVALATRNSHLAAPTWHLIGHLQTNKVRAALGTFAILHAVDSERLLRAIDGNATNPVPLMIEVNVAAEPTKYGILPEQLPDVLDVARGLTNVRVTGLMTVAPRVSEPEAARPVFGELRKLAERHGLRHLSMGMTEDFETAIEEGATHIRVGRALFGERQ